RLPRSALVLLSLLPVAPGGGCRGQCPRLPEGAPHVAASQGRRSRQKSLSVLILAEKGGPAQENRRTLRIQDPARPRSLSSRRWMAAGCRDGRDGRGSRA